MIRYIKTAAAQVLVLCSVAACSPTVDYRGRLPDDIDTSKIKPALHNKDDVARILGSPSTVSAFDSNTWYYLTSTTETISFLDPTTVAKDIIALSFNENGVLKEIKQLSPDDARPVSVVNRSTSTSGQSTTVLQQVFGNFGRIAKNGPSAP